MTDKEAVELYDKASELHNADKHEEALGLYERLYDHYCNEYGQNDENTLSALYLCADELYVLGRYSEALPLMLTVDSYNDNNTAYSVSIIDTKVKLCSLYVELCEYEKALLLSRELFSFTVEKYGTKSKECVRALGAFAKATAASGDVNTALSYRLRQLDIAEEVCEAWEVAWIKRSVADIFSKQQKYDDSIRLLHEAYDTLCAECGEHSYNAMSVLDMMGTVYENMEQPDKSMECRKQSYENALKYYGDERNTHIAATNYALALCNNGRYTEALSLIERASQWHLVHNGENSDDYINSLINLTLVYAGLERYEQAFECNERAYKLHYAVKGEEHPDTISALRELAVCYADLGNYDMAIEIVEQVRDKYKNVLHDNEKYANACDQIEYYKSLKNGKEDQDE